MCYGERKDKHRLLKYLFWLKCGSINSVAAVSRGRKRKSAQLSSFNNAHREALRSIAVSIPASHAGDRGSIPRRGVNIFGEFFSLEPVFRLFSIPLLFFFRLFLSFFFLNNKLYYYKGIIKVQITEIVLTYLLRPVAPGGA